MILTRSIRHAVPDCDVNLFVVRSAKVIPKGFIHAPVLSPSIELFSSMLYWKKEDTWWRHWEDFEEAFELEMTKELPMRYFQRIEELLQQGKSVQFVCFCPSSDYCHRRLLAEHFSDRYGVFIE